MNETLELLKKATRSGWKTSEFWLSLGGLAFLFFDPQITAGVNNAADHVSRMGGAGAIAGGAIVGGYAVGRGIVKAATAKAILEPVPPPAAIVVPAPAPAESSSSSSSGSGSAPR